ncbi:MAG: hypothetical protein AB1352_00205 [Patescibacteria group bacterium]
MKFAACAGEKAGMVVFRLLHSRGNSDFINIVTLKESNILCYSLISVTPTKIARDAIPLGYKNEDQAPTLEHGNIALGFRGKQLSYSRINELTYETRKGTIISLPCINKGLLKLIARSNKPTLFETIQEGCEEWNNDSISITLLTSKGIFGYRGKKGYLYTWNGIISNINHRNKSITVVNDVLFIIRN